MIPLHATATADPQQLRWVIAADGLPPAGTVRQAPGRLGALLDSGVIDEMVVRTALNKGEVLITLSAGSSWRELGDDIREALSDALLNPAGWRVDASDNTSQLAAIAAELLAGPIGALAESHGGSIELVSVVGRDRDRSDVGRVPRVPGRRLYPARQTTARTAPPGRSTGDCCERKRVGCNAIG